MSATYTPGSGADLDRVRLLIPDKDISGLAAVDGVYTLTSYSFTDEEIADFLDLASNDVYLAAALALESFISTGAQSGGKVSGFGFSIDTSAGWAALERRIVWLRSQSASTAAFTFVDITRDADSSAEYERPPDYWP